jgi:hypothetical protein
MRALTVSLVTLAATVAAFGCSSTTDPGAGLSGGSTGKGGTVGVGGTGNGATSGNSTSGGNNGSGGSVVIGTGGSIGSGASNGTGATSGTMGAAGACTGTSATGQKGAGAVVLFLVDTSLSMASPPSGMMGGRGMMGGGGMSKMASTQAALTQAFAALSPALNVGLVFFPHVAETATVPCFDPTVEVPIAPLDATQLMLLDTQVNGAMPAGSTPTHDAYQFAVDTLKASTAEGDKYIVLITDGEPTFALNCVGDGMTGVDTGTTGPLIDAAAAAYTTNGIKTFVVGSPGSDRARGALSAMARVGGTGPAGCMDTGTPAYCHFDMTTSMNFSASLTAALGAITQQIPVDCAFDLPTPPLGMTLDLKSVNVTVTNDDMTKTEIARDPGNDCATDGWVYVGDPPTGVKLCGKLCDSVKAQGMPSIDVQFGCGQRVNPPR